MAKTKKINNVDYTIPETGEDGWGANVTAYLEAIADGGIFTGSGSVILSQDLNLGNTAGIVVKYVKSNSANIADSGIIRLANGDDIAWRNNAKGANLVLEVDASDKLIFNTKEVLVTDNSATVTNKSIDLDSNTVSGTLSEFNTALQGDSFTSLTGSETLTNKTLTSPVINSPTNIVKGDVGLGNVDNTSDATKNSATATLTNKTVDLGDNTITGSLAEFNAALQSESFTSLTGSETLTNKTLTAPVINSPTNIVKADVGLGNVDNTSDDTKNSATATLTNKTLTSPVINTPSGIVKGDVGLGNVDNTSDTTKNSATVTLTNKTIDSDDNTITNIVNADIKAAAAIDATKIADGTVTSTEFQYINSLSSNAQTQLDAKLPTSSVQTSTSLGSDNASPPSQLAVKTYVDSAVSGAGTGVKITSANYTILDDDNYAYIDVTTSTNTIVITLPAVSSNTGRNITVRKADSGSGKVTVKSEGASVTINGVSGSTGVDLTSQYDVLEVFEANSLWGGFGPATSTYAGFLSRYEEGTWSPAAGSNALNVTGTPTFGDAKYTRIGNRVFATIASITGLTCSSNNSNAYWTFTSTGLPGATNSTGHYGSVILYRGGDYGAPKMAGVDQWAGSDTEIMFWFESSGAQSFSNKAITLHRLNFSYYI